MRSNDLSAEITALSHLSSARLRKRWASVTGKVVPRVSPSLLRLALTWELQAKANGGLSRRTRQRLDQLVEAKTETRTARPGMRLVREWNGTLHIVTIGEDNVIRWNDREWRSLSEVARALTGTRWSGPAFFGLKQRQRAA